MYGQHWRLAWLYEQALAGPIRRWTRCDTGDPHARGRSLARCRGRILAAVGIFDAAKTAFEKVSRAKREYWLEALAIND